MAERRMFAKTIIDSDAFLDMPLSAQSLYFHLSMRADDDGFINNPRKIQRMIGASEDDLKLLLVKRFLLPFDSGVCVVKHWLIHNLIKADRYKATVYQEEKAQLLIKKNKAYSLNSAQQETELLASGDSFGTQVEPNRSQVGTHVESQVRLGKDRIVKDRDILPGAKAPDRPSEIDLPLNDKSEYPVYKEQVKEWSELYPAVDVMQELRKMKGWLTANPKRKKTRRGITRFITGWLAKEQDKGRYIEPPKDETKLLN